MWGGYLIIPYPPVMGSLKMGRCGGKKVNSKNIRTMTARAIRANLFNGRENWREVNSL